MSDTNNHSKNIIHRILTEQINLTSNELDTKSTKETVSYTHLTLPTSDLV